MTNPDTLLVFDQTVTRAGVEGWLRHLESAGAPTEMYRLGGTVVLSVTDGDLIDTAGPQLPAPTRQLSRTSEVWLGRKELRPGGTEVALGPTIIGDGSVAVIAGPCAVESSAQTMATAAAVTDHGAVGLRGGVFKPRTSPHSFQGLQWDGLDLLAEARERTGLPVVTEVLETESVEVVAEYSDILQIGARNIQNFTLLRRVGEIGKPVLLKRGMATSIQEFLLSAEYILSAGNPNVILCERGIRTFETATRFTLDLNAVPVLKKLCHLPVVVDPSHGTGHWDLVAPMAKGAVACGADGLIIEVHPRPEEALSDGPQSLKPSKFAQLMRELRPVAEAVGRGL